mmetsp:Transcript_35165/g.41476  ORF Transcript_35165/g.41476 Transcript_35165/m.41476 type:complete len:96 (+) Transcript_35165:559-846(+)
MWKGLSSELNEKWTEMASQDLERYENEMNAYLEQFEEEVEEEEDHDNDDDFDEKGEDGEGENEKKSLPQRKESLKKFHPKTKTRKQKKFKTPDQK